jgi:glycosyltransferase involved in cell wall biosynthesis
MIKNVAFLVRDDFFSKVGGDTIQIQGYASELTTQGVDVLYLYPLSDFMAIESPIDCYIVVNLDRAYDCSVFYSKLKALDLLRKTFVVPIHHQDDAVVAFNKYRFGLFGFLVFDGLFVERLRLCNLIFKRKFALSQLTKVFGDALKRSAQHLLLECRGVIAIAKGEIDVINRDFDVDISAKSRVIYNAIPSSSNNDKLGRDIDVLVSGRIEARKNQLNIIRALSATGLKVVFVGALNGNNRAFCERFINELKKHSNFEYLGAVSHDEMMSLYNRAKIHLSASWMEVSSLVDIEAYSRGCIVFSSINGHTSELVPPTFYRGVNPSNLSDLSESISRCLEGYSDVVLQNVSLDSRTWADAGKELYTFIND